MYAKFHMLSWRDAAGCVRPGDFPRPEYQIGNAKHWATGLTTEWQIRPSEPTDLLLGVALDPRVWLLAKQVNGVGGVYYSIALPPHLRRNTPKNVREAVKRAMRARPKLFAAVRKLEALSRSISSEAMASRDGATLH